MWFLSSFFLRDIFGCLCVFNLIVVQAINATCFQLCMVVGFFTIKWTVFFSIGISLFLVLRLGISIKMDVSNMILPPPPLSPCIRL